MLISGPAKSDELIAGRESAVRGFFGRESDGLARACHEMARAFAAGGTLFPFGAGTAATDAAHVAVEFMHPVIVGKRALPALAPGNDPTASSTLARMARPGDIALGIAHRPDDPALAGFLSEARSLGLLTIALTAAPARTEDGAAAIEADHVFTVAADDPAVVQ